ncbi:MAG: hypothetical protein IID43_02055 [Planctomycetes bacterium]|nr:hypothetical protein [Planctomycetota bacterium]
MTQETPEPVRAGLADASGLPHIVRILGFAVDPAKLGLATAALIATLAFGALLDVVWTAGSRVGEDAIGEMTSTSRFDLLYEEPEGEFGIFQVWCEHEKRCVAGVLGLSWLDPSGRSADLARGQRSASTLATRADAVAGMWHGVWWMLRHHTLFFLVFGAGSLLIWSVAGGAICRMTAVQFTRDEKLTITASMAFVRRNLFRGFYLAPCIPLAFALIITLLLFLGGVLLRLPVLGDLVSGIAFLLAIVGGFVITALLVGLVVGGSLLWPAVATEGSDAFDAFSRSMSFAFSKKSVVYAFLALVYAAVCWAIVRWFTILGLSVTHTIVGLGTSPFGWWSRGVDGEPLSKLALIWPGPEQGSVHAWPNWSQLGFFECVSAALIGIVVLLGLYFVVRALSGAVRELLDGSVRGTLEELQGTAKNVRGTTEFMADSAVRPLIRVISVARGIRRGVRSVTGLRSRSKD